MDKKDDPRETEDPEVPPPHEIEDPLKELLRALRKYRSKHMKQFPELYRSDVSTHPSYTRLKVFPYRVVCRHRVQRLARQLARQMNREIMHFVMIQMFALNGVRIDRVFSVGMSPKLSIVPDPLTERERRRLNDLFRD